MGWLVSPHPWGQWSCHRSVDRISYENGEKMWFIPWQYLYLLLNAPFTYVWQVPSLVFGVSPSLGLQRCFLPCLGTAAEDKCNFLAPLTFHADSHVHGPLSP